MKKGILQGGLMLGCMACAGLAQAVIITSGGAYNQVGTVGTWSDIGSLECVTAIDANNSNNPDFQQFKITGLDLDGVGGADDEVVLDFSVTGGGGGPRSSTANGFVGVGNYAVGAGQSVTFSNTSITVLLGGVANATWTANSTFDGFNSLDQRAQDWGGGSVNSGMGAGETGTVANITFTAGDIGSPITFALTDSLTVGYASPNGGYKVGGTGFQVTAIPEPATLGLVAAFGGAILFIRRRLLM